MKLNRNRIKIEKYSRNSRRINHCKSLSSSTADILFRLRDCLWDVVRYIINNQGQLLVNQCQQLPMVEEFKDKMLTIINELLEENSNSSDSSGKLKAGNFSMIKSTNIDDQNKFTEYDEIDMETDSENEDEFASDSEYEDESETDAYDENDRA